MFFDDIFVKNDCLRKLWRAAHNQEENICWLEICQTLDRYVSSEDKYPRKRMSLRTSSLLINGAAKMYQQDVQKLLDDLDELIASMIKRNRQTSESTEDEDTIDSSESYDTPEQMIRHVENEPDISMEVLTIQSNITRSRPSKSTESHSNENDQSQQPAKNSTTGSYQSKKITESLDYPSSPLSHSRTNNSDQFVQSERSEENLETERSANEQNEARISSPTFTDVFDFVANLPNNEEDVPKKRLRTEKPDDRMNSEKNSDDALDAVTEDIAEAIAPGRSKSDIGGCIVYRSAMTPAARSGKNYNRTDRSQGRSPEKSIILTSKVQKKSRCSKTMNKVAQHKPRVDIATQHNPRCRNDEVDLNLREPYGYLFIHNCQHSRLPSGIVISSLNEDIINNLLEKNVNL